ncbi:MAG: chemotaxis protein CheW [Deltaproteobacteria bacterium]|nr:chemotaxis protein CheW [Deltaproteobacteria bacterium]
MSPGNADPVVELCAVAVGEAEYVIDLRRVREILPATDLVPVPRGPEWVDGVVHLRGAALPAVDARRRLGLPPRPEGQRPRILLVAVGRRTIALLVDAVVGVVRLPRSALRPAEGLTPGGPRLFLGICGGGAGRGAARLRLLLDVKALLQASAPEEARAARRTEGPA